MADILQSEITSEQIERYQSDGVVCLKSLFTRDWIDYLAEWVDRSMAEPGPYGEEYDSEKGRFFGDLDLARRLQGFRQFVDESPAAAIAGRIMNSRKINFFYDQLLVKEPGTTARTPWHQDQPYWAVSGRQVCSIWLPLDRIKKENCVEYIAGSHYWDEFNPYHFNDGSPYENTGLPEIPNIESERSKYKIVSFDLEPGDCIVFQAMIVHGAPGNTLRSRRRALATRWTGDDARYLTRSGEVAIPTRDPGLNDGDPLDCDDFPVIWRA